MPQDSLIFLGFAVVFIGIIIIVIGSLLGSERSDVKVGVGGFIGPIPFGFANDKNLLYVIIAVAVTVFIFSLVFSRLL